MIELTTIGQFISTIGFPIFVAVYMLVFLNNTIKSLTKTLRKIETQNEILISILSQKRRDDE